MWKNWRLSIKKHLENPPTMKKINTDVIDTLIEKWQKDSDVRKNVLKPENSLFYTTEDKAKARGLVPAIVTFISDLKALKEHLDMQNLIDTNLPKVEVKLIKETDHFCNCDRCIVQRYS